ncbi:MAG: DUF1559 domain-containing protein [Gemmataceae bacterium]
MLRRVNPVSHSCTTRRGLTLLEVVVVVSIVGILSSLLACGIARVRVASMRVQCASKLGQLALAVHQHEVQHGRFPVGCAKPLARNLRDEAYYCGVGWLTSILPYVEQERLWSDAQEANAKDPVGRSVLHRRVRATTIRAYVCPQESSELGGGTKYGGVWGITSYVGVAGTGVRADDGVFHPNLSVGVLDITDGASNTVMIGERPAGPNGELSGWYSNWGNTTCAVAQIMAAGSNRWTAYEYVGCSASNVPLRPPQGEAGCGLAHFWSRHGEGANFALADGSVRFLSYSIGEALPALATRAGGEVVAIP